MGWVNYSSVRGIPNLNLNLEDSNSIKWFISLEERGCYFLIKEKFSIKKENDKKIKIPNYNFLIITNKNNKKYNILNKTFVSNLELLYLIRENLACNQQYARFFQINSILK